jgi:hypothetical protein
MLARCIRFQQGLVSVMDEDRSATPAKIEALADASQKIELAAAAVDRVIEGSSDDRKEQLLRVRTELECAIELIGKRLA